jgi:hypothetical protein
MSDKNEKISAIFIFLILLICYGFFFPRWASWSQNSRLDLVLAIVDEGQLSIDSYYENTGDYAYYRGHYYSDKAPGQSFLSVPIYAIYKVFLKIQPINNLLETISQSSAFESTLRENGTGLLPGKIYFASALYFVTFFVVSLPAAGLGVLLYTILRYWMLSKASRFFLTLIYGLATPAFSYSGMLLSHQLVAFLLFLAFYLAFISKKESISQGRTFLIGLLLGWAVISEYPAVFIAFGIAIYLIWLHRSITTLIWGTIGAFLPISLLMAYDWLIFESILPKGYLYSVNYHQLHDVGLVSITYPKLDALWGITFSPYRGLFFLSPILLFGVIGLFTWWRQRIFVPEMILCVWSIITLFLFNSSSIMWEGGYAVGPRYIVPMLPFLMICLGVSWERIKSNVPTQIVIGVLSLWSFVAIWIETISGQSFPDWTPNPLINYSIPRFLSGDIARNLGMAFGFSKHLSLLPLALSVLCLSMVYLIINYWFVRNSRLEIP